MWLRALEEAAKRLAGRLSRLDGELFRLDLDVPVCLGRGFRSARREAVSLS